MITVKVSDLRKMIEELEKDGIDYVDVTEVEEMEIDNDIIPKSLNFEAYDGTGGGIDFGEIEHIEVDAFYKCN